MAFGLLYVLICKEGVPGILSARFSFGVSKGIGPDATNKWRLNHVQSNWIHYTN